MTSIVYGSVTDENEEFGGWYLTIESTTTGTDLIAEVLESGDVKASANNLTVQ